MSEFDPHRSPSRLGDFSIVGILGEGGSGTVFDARWGHREVALKVLKGEMTSGDRERFLAEARLLIEMTHPGVVKVLAAGSLPDGRPYLAMEKLPGESLARRLGRGPIPLSHAITLFVQLCDAVAAMHARDLIHRDLKPENVMLVAGPTGEHAVLLDFGIAKLASDGVAVPTQSGLVRGTPAYMAPERFFGHPASIATDVYELAVTLFAMIAGRLPWADNADPEVRLNPVRLATVTEVPQALDELVARALSTRAPVRPPTVMALCTAVAEAAGSEGAVARATERVRPTPPPAFIHDAPTKDDAGWASPQRANASGDYALGRMAADRVTTGAAASGQRAVMTAQVRRRWPFAVGAMLAAGAGIVAMIVASRGEPAARKLVTGPDDPWSGEGPRKVFPVDAAEPTEVDGGAVEPPMTHQERVELREAMADVMRHHAPDLEGVLSIAMAEVRRTPDLKKMFRSLRATPGVPGIVDHLLGECELGFGDRAEWISLGLVDDVVIFDLIARGDWTREEIEACVVGDTGKLVRRGKDGALSVITEGAPPGSRVLGWIDERTFYVSGRGNADAAFVSARLTRSPAATTRVHELAAGIDRRATLWMVASQESLGRVLTDPTLKGADLTARLVLDDTSAEGRKGAGFGFNFYFADEAAARAGHDAMRDEVSEILDYPGFGLVMPEWTFRRDGSTVLVQGMIPGDLLDKFQDVLVEYLEK